MVVTHKPEFNAITELITPERDYASAAGICHSVRFPSLVLNFLFVRSFGFCQAPAERRVTYHLRREKNSPEKKTINSKGHQTGHCRI